MSSSPSILLPCCPMCSAIGGHLTRPLWKRAEHATRARGKPCFIWTGCQHSDDGKSKVRDDPEEWSLVEDNWNREAAALLNARVEGWPEAAADRFRREIGANEVKGFHGPTPLMEPMEKRAADATTKSAGKAVADAAEYF